MTFSPPQEMTEIPLFLYDFFLNLF